MGCVSFVVEGRAVPQGSKRAFVNPATGRAVMVEQTGKRHKSWREAVANAARSVTESFDEAVSVNLVFEFTLQKSHYYIRKSGRELRGDAPTIATSRSIGDIDKLSRSVLDSLTNSGLIRDDSQVVRLHAYKLWTPSTDSCTVIVTPLGGESNVGL